MQFLQSFCCHDSILFMVAFLCAAFALRNSTREFFLVRLYLHRVESKTTPRKIRDLIYLICNFVDFLFLQLQRGPFSTHLFSPFLTCRAIPNICHSSVNIALVCSNTRGQEIVIPSCIREIVDIDVHTVRRLFQEGKCLFSISRKVRQNISYVSKLTILQ